MPAAADPVIEFREVVKRFGQTAAVDHVTFTVGAGETVSLLGPSGCGKTTTLRLISGFEEPDEGSIEIAGESMIGKRPYERNVGLLFQHYALFPHMTVAENVAYGLKHRGWPKAEIPGRVAEMLRLVQLEGFDTRRPGQMSGGQQQRVALARVLATKPKLVLLDEPLSALDAKLREELRLELKQILTAVGSTTIVVTHDQDEAMSLADRIIIMNRGRIEQQGTPDDIYMRGPGRPSSPPSSGAPTGFTAACRMTWGAACPAWSPKPAPGWRFAIPAPPAARVRGARALRPERIVVAGPETTAIEIDENQLPGRVVDVVNMGAEFHFTSSKGRGGRG